MSRMLSTYEDWKGTLLEDLGLADGSDFADATVVDLWMSGYGVPSQLLIRTGTGYECVVPWHAITSYRAAAVPSEMDGWSGPHEEWPADVPAGTEIRILPDGSKWYKLP